METGGRPVGFFTAWNGRVRSILCRDSGPAQRAASPNVLQQLQSRQNGETGSSVSSGGLNPNLQGSGGKPLAGRF